MSVADGTVADGRIDDLPRVVRAGDVWVLNDAATLPASIAGRAKGRDVEVRLAGQRRAGTWLAVLFGEGSWRDDTDRRPAPPVLRIGDAVDLGGRLRARVLGVDADSPRLIELAFEPGGDAFWRALYARGRPIQYSYLHRDLALGQLQTGYAARPWAVELPSAGRPLTPARLDALRHAGARIVTLTHAAGLSATGDPGLDARLPLPERFEIPAATAAAIAGAREDGRRVVAVGTSVTRALEGCARDHGEIRAGAYETDLRLGPNSARSVVDALLTGAHDPSSSHYALLRAFAPAALLSEAVSASSEAGYLGHELGDSWFLG